MSTESIGDGKEVRRAEPAIRVLLLLMAAGLVFILLFAWRAPNSVGVFSVACMFATSSTLAGGLFGFLFGIPRTYQHDRQPEEHTLRKDNAESIRSSYAPNTNLEQISDWLTKILVGAGLIQFGRITEFLRSLSLKLAPAFGGGEAGRIFALSTVLTYVFLGFLIGYLWTRLYFAGALRDADFSSLRREVAMRAADVQEIKGEVKEIREQNDLDAKAISLVLKQLNPSIDGTVPTQQELDEAIKDASAPMKAQIFYQAQTLRQETWSEARTKAKMERTIPIFRALIQCDRVDEFHRNHGQLGYALKDSRTPNLIEAEAVLSKAIQIRGVSTETGWLYYEFNRALCRILLDDPKIERASSAEARAAISEDLSRVLSNRFFVELVQRTPEITRWMEVNGFHPAR